MLYSHAPKRECTRVPKQGSIVASTTGIALLTLLSAIGVVGVTWRLIDEVVVDGNDVIVEVEDDVLVCRCGGKR